MNKYINSFNSIEEITASISSYSPNVSYVDGANNSDGLVYTNIGDNEGIKFFNNNSIVEGKSWLQVPLTFTALEANSSVMLSKAYDNINPTYEISTDDGTTWSSYTLSTVITLSNVGDRVMFRGDNSGISFNSSKYVQYSMSGSIRADGNIMSILDSTMQLNSVPSYGFYSLFSGCSSLTKAPLLPATTLANQCYTSMFQGCTSLTSAPELPATNLKVDCYNSMFQGCTSLTTAPELPATTLADLCYKGMFNGCTSLIKSPSLPATTLAQECYSSMFYGCTSLTSAPELPATTLAGYCYFYMFKDCTSLKTAPQLPATTLSYGCYEYMFRGCTSLTTAPELPATTLINGCYDSMFSGCTSLEYLPSIMYGIQNYMFSNCSNIKQLIIPSTVTSITNNSFSGISISVENFINNSSVTEGYPWGLNIYYYVVDNWYCNENYEITGGKEKVISDLVLPREIQGIACDLTKYVSKGGGLRPIPILGFDSITILNEEKVITLSYTYYIGRYSRCPIYVPDALVEDYKVANNWSNYANYIKPLSEKPVL